MTDLFEAEAPTTTTLDLRRLQREQRRAARRKWTLIALAVGLVLVAVGATIGIGFLQSFQSQESAVADFDGAGQGTVQVIVAPGDSASAIASTLFDAGVIASPEAFIAVALDQSDAAKSITPGYYILQREMRAEYAFNALLDPANKEVRTVRVPEGLRLAAYYERIANALGTTTEEVAAVAENTEALGLPAEADGNLEGWLFPSTYTFDPNVEPVDVLSTMITTTVQLLEKYEVPADEWVETLTMASLIEREARLDIDRPLISSVIHNRVAIDMPLQFDSTVKYISPSEGVFTTAEERAIESPYNTYFTVGLPPAPIAGAGEKSIAAAVNPEATDYLYFVTVNFDTGETLYSDTYDGHLKNVDVMQQWVADNSDTSDDA
jgi:UPF0755 protein